MQMFSLEPTFVCLGALTSDARALVVFTCIIDPSWHRHATNDIAFLSDQQCMAVSDTLASLLILSDILLTFVACQLHADLHAGVHFRVQF